MLEWKTTTYRRYINYEYQSRVKKRYYVNIMHDKCLMNASAVGVLNDFEQE